MTDRPTDRPTDRQIDRQTDQQYNETTLAQRNDHNREAEKQAVLGQQGEPGNHQTERQWLKPCRNPQNGYSRNGLRTGQRTEHQETEYKSETESEK